MSRAILSAGLDLLRGKVSGQGAASTNMVMRVKTYRDDRGRIIMMGPQEYYRLRKRDYKHSPRTEAEKAQAQTQFDGGCDAFLNEGRTEKVVYGMFPVFVRMVLLKEKKNSPMS